MVERNSSLSFSCSSASFCSDDDSSDRRRGEKRREEREGKKGEREEGWESDNQPLYQSTLLLSIPSLTTTPCTWRVDLALQFSVFCIQSCHRLHCVLLTILYLHCSLRLQHTPSTQTVWGLKVNATVSLPLLPPHLQPPSLPPSLPPSTHQHTFPCGQG